MQYPTTPNFPLLITASLIEVYGNPWNNDPCMYTLPYGSQWYIYAEKYSSGTHWRVSVVSGINYLIFFDAANEDEHYALNIQRERIAKDPRAQRTEITPYNQSKKWLDRGHGRR